jgi:uncharacterized protein
MLLKSLITLLFAGICFVVILYLGQDRMIYFPRHYAPQSKAFSKVDMVHFQSDGLQQTAFLFPVGRTTKPTTIWWCFGGNGSTAIDWLSFLMGSDFPDGHIFVLVDYPGYGRCFGKPSDQSIYASVQSLHQTLATRWGMEAADLSSRSKVMGHSLGAAVALHTAARFEMQEVIAISPFTSLDDMAKLRMGFLHVFLRHHFDNRDSIRRLIAQSKPPQIHIFHGSIDGLIPVTMGRELANLAGKQARFYLVRDAGHNDVLDPIQNEVIELLKN